MADPPGISAWWLAAPLLLLTVLILVLSAMLERSGPIRLRHWAEEAGGRLRALYASPVRFELFRYLLNVAAKSLPVVLFFVLWRTPVGRGLAAGVALGVVVIVLAGTELANRALVGRDPEAILRRLTGAYRTLLLVLTPLVVALAPLLPPGGVERREEEEEEDDEASEEEIEAFIRVGTREGILEPEEEDLVWRLVDFGDAQVRGVMTPRIDIVCAPADGDLESLMQLFLECKHSRVPIYEGSIDQIVGILHLRDLVRGLRSSRRRTARELSNAPYFVPEAKPLPELLKEFQSRRQQMAIVVDEYGGTAGLVTAEDVVEEIVGEIVDEHEVLTPEVEAAGDGRWRLDGRSDIEILDELFDVDLDESAYQTVGGFIFGSLGYIPAPGEVVESHGLRFTVEEVQERRIQTVVVERAAPEEEAEGV